MSEDYDVHLEYVLQRTGALTEHIAHSKSNQVLMDGAHKLGYRHRLIAQSTGAHPDHSCAYCHLKCNWGIKQGSTACLLREAVANGAQFVDQIEVQQIVSSVNVAFGLRCINRRNGNRFLLAGGSLKTPVVLQKCGFRNRHIGRNLKLHPISALLVVLDCQKTDPQHHTIMTALCLEAKDLNGKYHDAKIEVLLRSPSIATAFLPWSSSDQLCQDPLKYQYISAFLTSARDTLTGRVTYDPENPGTLVVDYDINEADRHSIATALLYAMDIAYIEGAREIIHPYYVLGRFRSARPTGERTINNPDYQAFRSKYARTRFPRLGVGYGSAHQMSTYRMSGKGPHDGACHASGLLFECGNVYVANASATPNASGNNPIVTTMPFAWVSRLPS